MKPKEQSNSASLSFLDVIACAFGAIVLLVLIIPIGEFGVKGDSPELRMQYGEMFFSVEAIEDEIKGLQGEIASNNALLANLSADTQQKQAYSRSLEETLEQATAERKRIENLQISIANAGSTLEKKKLEIEKPTEYSGIPVDSEYVAFVIDTSGSMRAIKDEVVDEFTNLMNLYPKIKGFQVLNDRGIYLYSSQQRKWLNDTRGGRINAKSAIKDWRAYSNSSPDRGIATAIEDLYRQDIKMAIFVLGDDYSQGNLESFLNRVERVASRKKVKQGTLRIHGIAFANPSGGVNSALDFAIMMRELTKTYGGAFLALPFEDKFFLSMRAVEDTFTRSR